MIIQLNNNFFPFLNFPEKSENPISLLQSLFQEISNNKKKVGVISTKKFMAYVRKKNGFS